MTVRHTTLTESENSLIIHSLIHVLEGLSLYLGQHGPKT
nr:unnamed protein product [Callosobruchus chinensis]